MKLKSVGTWWNEKTDLQEAVRRQALMLSYVIFTGAESIPLR